MKKILSLLLILLVLPLATASFKEVIEPRVDEINQGLDVATLEKVSMALPADVEMDITDTGETIILQATTEGLVILDSLENDADITIRGDESAFMFFNKEGMTMEEIATGVKDLTIEGNTFKGRLAIKAVAEYIEKEYGIVLNIERPEDEGFFSTIWRGLTAPIIGIVGWFI